MIYEYECLSCHDIIKYEHSITSEPERLLYCPRCDRMTAVKRLISRSSFVLRGNTWAKDGYSEDDKKSK